MGGMVVAEPVRRNRRPSGVCLRRCPLGFGGSASPGLLPARRGWICRTPPPSDRRARKPDLGWHTHSADPAAAGPQAAPPVYPRKPMHSVDNQQQTTSSSRRRLRSSMPNA